MAGAEAAWRLGDHKGRGTLLGVGVGGARGGSQELPEESEEQMGEALVYNEGTHFPELNKDPARSPRVPQTLSSSWRRELCEDPGSRAN